MAKPRVPVEKIPSTMRWNDAGEMQIFEGDPADIPAGWHDKHPDDPKFKATAPAEAEKAPPRAPLRRPVLRAPGGAESSGE